MVETVRAAAADRPRQRYAHRARRAASDHERGDGRDQGPPHHCQRHRRDRGRTLGIGFPWQIARGFSLIGRAAGLVGHIAEEIDGPLGIDIWRIVGESVAYEGKASANAGAG